MAGLPEYPFHCFAIRNQDPRNSHAASQAELSWNTNPLSPHTPTILDITIIQFIRALKIFLSTYICTYIIVSNLLKLAPHGRVDFQINLMRCKLLFLSRVIKSCYLN